MKTDDLSQLNLLRRSERVLREALWFVEQCSQRNIGQASRVAADIRATIHRLEDEQK